MASLLLKLIECKRHVVNDTRLWTGFERINLSTKTVTCLT